jgi:hypothetical protein
MAEGAANRLPSQTAYRILEGGCPARSVSRRDFRRSVDLRVYDSR